MQLIGLQLLYSRRPVSIFIDRIPSRNMVTAKYHCSFLHMWQATMNIVSTSSCSLCLKVKYHTFSNFSKVLWAHGLHLLFSPVWPVYSIDSCLDSPKSACFRESAICRWLLGKPRAVLARPQLINIQRLPEIALFRFAWPKGGGFSVSPIV